MSRGSKQALVGLGSLAAVLLIISFLAASGNRVKGLRADVLSARRAEPGDPVDVTVSVRDTKGRVTSVVVDFGDGRVETLDVTGEPCGAPLTRAFDLSHRFDFTGYTTVVAKVETGGCGSKPERVEAVRTIQIKPVRRG